jgi:hypothetical protein
VNREDSRHDSLGPKFQKWKIGRGQNEGQQNFYLPPIMPVKEDALAEDWNGKTAPSNSLHKRLDIAKDSRAQSRGIYRSHRSNDRGWPALSTSTSQRSNIRYIGSVASSRIGWKTLGCPRKILSLLNSETQTV